MNPAWPTVKLGEILTERQETPSPEDLLLGTIPIVSKITFDAGKIELRSGSETKTGMILARPGDLIVSGINAAKGAVAIYGPENEKPIAATIHYGAYTPRSDRADLRFLWWFFRSQYFRDILSEHVPGGIKTELKAKRLLPIPMPLPPLFEQQRIVARIDALAAEIEEAKRLRQEAAREADIISGAASKQILDETTNRVRLEELCHIITDGTHQTPQYTDQGAVFLSAQNVKPFRFMPENHRKVSFEDFKAYTTRVKPQKGDVLMTRVGAGIGEAAVVDREIEFALYVSLALIRTKKEALQPEFLVHWLNSLSGRALSRKETLGKGHSQGNLNLKLLRGFEIPVPPISEQRRIVAELDEMEAEVDTLKRHQAETAVQFDALLPAILDRAFRGEL